ncbi:MAG TPA: glycoside hydrolase family 5 protein [Oxalicibacterium sp.]|nr:glycoside hydrolase family 5 protein [Oxalicibacterium sp.]
MATASTKLKGVNLSGAEYDSNNIAAKPGYQYTYPSHAEIDYYKSKGFNVIRLPFSGSRLQPRAMGPLNKTELAQLRATVDYAASKRMYVILDPHEYGARYDAASKKKKYYGISGGVPASQFGNFWKLVAMEFKNSPNVIYGLMNEPNKQTAKQWRAVADYGVFGIRKAGAKQLILIPGTSWTGAHSWIKSGNAAAWTGFKDPNFAFEMHQYLDSDYSGTHSTCAAGKGAVVLKAATDWARAHHYKIFIGEAGWASNAQCLKEGTALMSYMSKNADVWNGWAYWSAGKWIAQSYMYMLTPANLSKPTDKPQMKALVANL